MLRKGLMVILIGFALLSFPASNGFATQPEYGGTLRIIYPYEAKVLGYPLEMGPLDMLGAFPAIEFLMGFTPQRQLKPFLAEAVDIDPENLMITFRLRKGVRFHDGSALDAEAVAFNFQIHRDAGHFPFIRSIEVLDPYAVWLHLTSFDNMMIPALGPLQIFSKQVLTTRSVEWLRTHPVGTGPFQLTEWKRGSHMRWEKNPDYWQRGKPYLDAIEIRFITEFVTAAMMMEKKEADVWWVVPTKSLIELEKKGLVRARESFPSSWIVLPNTKDPDRPTAKLKVREAIEHAIDKKGIAQALGRGGWKPNTMAVPDGEWGYDPDYAGRPYDPARARQLFIEAGYATPLKLELMVIGTYTTVGAAIKSCMDEAGFSVDVDVADYGRFYGSMYSTGWQDLLLTWYGPDINSLVLFQHYFGQYGLPLASFQRTPELQALTKEALTYLNEADQQAVAKKLVRLLSDEAHVIPISTVHKDYLTQPYVHSTFLKEPFGWRVFDDWMEKH